MIGAKLRSLRKRVWGKDDPAAIPEIGESLRDLHGFCERLTLSEVVPVTTVVWAEPFSFPVSRAAQLVLLGDARIAGTTDAVELAALQWTNQLSSSKDTYRVKIDRCATLQPGKSYDLKFLVVY